MLDPNTTLDKAKTVVVEARRLSLPKLMVLVFGAVTLGGAYFFADAWWKETLKQKATQELARVVVAAVAGATEAANRASHARARGKVDQKDANTQAGKAPAAKEDVSEAKKSVPERRPFEVKSAVNIEEGIVAATFQMVPLAEFDKKVYFPQGQYDMRHAYDQAEFVTAVIGTLRGVYDRYSESEAPAEIIFTGSADGVGRGGMTSIVYEGEFGPINLSAADTTINGTAQQVSIAKGRNVTNAELALLRALSVNAAFDNLYGNERAKIRFESRKFIARESEQTGKDHRFGQITIRFKVVGGVGA
jgi:hypothetical protein